MGMVSVLLALIIVCSLYFYNLKSGAPDIKPADKKFYQDAGVNTASYPGIIESTRKAVQAYENIPTQDFNQYFGNQ